MNEYPECYDEAAGKRMRYGTQTAIHHTFPGARDNLLCRFLILTERLTNLSSTIVQFLRLGNLGYYHKFFCYYPLRFLVPGYIRILYEYSGTQVIPANMGDK